MKFRQVLSHVVVRNLLGLLALLAVHYVSDQYAIDQRSGFNRLSPYLFLVLLYGWLVFHNRVLFERLYLHDKKSAYIGWALSILGASSLNMYLILRAQFNVSHTLPYLVSYWVYTITGLGIYVLVRHLRKPRLTSETTFLPIVRPVPTEFTNLVCVVNGEKQGIPCADILYVESLENYVK